MNLLPLLVAALFVTPAAAQNASAPVPAGAEAPAVAALAPLAWLGGCWRGSVGPREYREQWMPLQGGMLIGVSQTVAQGKTLDYEYLRLESRPDGVYYVAAPSGKEVTAFRLEKQSVERVGEHDHEIFTFAISRPEFPQRIVYRRAAEGWLYATVEGKIGDADRQLTYPMRRTGCESGEFILR